MDRSTALDLLTRHKPELARRFAVRELSLFGSTARDAAGASSDVDLLVAFEGPATSAKYFGLQFYLEDLMGCKVDLVTDKALRPELRPYVEREMIHV
ncbi:MAG: nucleotidyltransferase family protein [Ramlibacter sp.]